MSGAYYNEREPFCAAWLRELIKANLIAPGDVDERDMWDVTPDDVKGYTQAHFCAGIGGWSYALRLAGWRDDERVWTGSMPCQPFSQAGKRLGFADERHLWPAFAWLIGECRPTVVFGEQVASPDGRVWLAGVRADLAGMGYAVGAADLCAAGVSAPHIRQRLYWVADASITKLRPEPSTRYECTDGQDDINCENGLAVAVGFPGQEERPHVTRRAERSRPQGDLQRSTYGGVSPGLDDAHRYHEHWWSGPLQVGWNCIAGEITRSGRRYDAQWRLKPGLSILAHGVRGRVGKLCGYGNAIVPQVAAEFVGAWREARKGDGEGD